jgi:hypothetical protein
MDALFVLLVHLDSFYLASRVRISRNIERFHC